MDDLLQCITEIKTRIAEIDTTPLFDAMEEIKQNLWKKLN